MTDYIVANFPLVDGNGDNGEHNFHNGSPNRVSLNQMKLLDSNIRLHSGSRARGGTQLYSHEPNTAVKQTAPLSQMSPQKASNYDQLSIGQDTDDSEPIVLDELEQKQLEKKLAKAISLAESEQILVT